MDYALSHLRSAARVGRRAADLFPDSRKNEVEISKDESVATIWVGIAGDGQETASKEAVEALRDDVVPATIGEVDGTRASVNGMTAEELDFNDTLTSHLPLVVGFVILFGLSMDSTCSSSAGSRSSWTAA
jgi:hypothetical protein